MNQFRKLGVLAALTSVVALIGAAPAFATSTVVTAVVSAGTLSLTAPATATVTPVTLNGLDQTSPYSMALQANDNTGSGAGWNLTITSTIFTSGAPVHTLSATASSLTGVTAVCTGPGTCVNPTNGIGYPVAVPAGAGPPAAVKFFNAAVNTGMGNFTVTPTVAVSFPAATFVGTYTSTVTLAIVSAP
jgi:hypothetical protein